MGIIYYLCLLVQLKLQFLTLEGLKGTQVFSFMRYVLCAGRRPSQVLKVNVNTFEFGIKITFTSFWTKIGCKRSKNGFLHYRLILTT